MQIETPGIEEQPQAKEIADNLTLRYGPLIGGDDLMRALGYENGQAFRQACRQNRVGINVFNVPARRGKYALTIDVARWLVQVSGLTQSQPDRAIHCRDAC